MRSWKVILWTWVVLWVAALGAPTPPTSRRMGDGVTDTCVPSGTDQVVRHEAGARGGGRVIMDTEDVNMGSDVDFSDSGPVPVGTAHRVADQTADARSDSACVIDTGGSGEDSGRGGDSGRGVTTTSAATTAISDATLFGVLDADDDMHARLRIREMAVSVSPPPPALLFRPSGGGKRRRTSSDSTGMTGVDGVSGVGAGASARLFGATSVAWHTGRV